MRRHSRPFVLVAAAAIVLSGCAGGEIRPAWTFAPVHPPSAAAPTPAAVAEPDPAPPAPADGEVLGSIEIRGFDLGYDPATVTVDAPGRYEFVLVNDGSIPHDIKFPDGTVIYAVGGETASAEVDVPAEGLEFICSIPGHADAGMKGSVSVSGDTAAPTPAPDYSGGGHGDGHGGAAPPANVVAPDPNAPEPTLYDARAPGLLEGETHEIELVMTEREMVVAPGFVQKVWTFGDIVPGPVIRVKVGDTVRVRLINPIENEMPHSIDFHSSMVAWNDEMRSINPGEELIYEWVANYAGVWMYHCGTAPALHHIANGMYGMVIVEPVGGLPEVDHEFAFVQSEWYLGPQGEVSSLARAQEAAPAPDFVVFNGVANQYLDNPLRVETGDRVRAFVLNAGPSVDSSFHIVGTIFDTVIKEGIALTRGNEGSWGSQAVDLAPAQGAIVEFEFAEDGLYPVVTHAFNFVGRGALGLFQSGEVDMPDDAGH